MRTVIYILLFTLASSPLKATNQIADLLFYNKDTLSFYDSPLEQIKNITSKIHELNENLISSSDCWRDYRAEWKLINNTLYLSDVYEGISNKKINKVIEKIVGCKFKNGLMRADWVNGTIWTGKDIVLEKTLYTSIFKHECKMYFENGTLVSSDSFDFIPCDSPVSLRLPKEIKPRSADGFAPVSLRLPKEIKPRSADGFASAEYMF